MYSQVQTLLTQFRTRYPMGSLVSELLTTHQDNYVVRVSVQMGGVTLATGLAAAANIETAEDRARERSLEALGILHRPLLATNLPAPLMPDRSPESRLSDTPILSSELALTNPLEPVVASSQLGATGINPSEFTAAPTKDPAEENSLPSNPLPATPMPIIADFYAHATADPEPLESSRTLLMDTGNAYGKLPVSDRPTPKPQSRVMEQSNIVPTPLTTPVTPTNDNDPQIDLSEVLAQIDVEMQRLGWNRKKGREHLKQSYGKETRSELEIDELFDFLQYLESQPV